MTGADAVEANRLNAIRAQRMRAARLGLGLLLFSSLGVLFGCAVLFQR